MDLLENWNEEKCSAYLYVVVSAAEKDPAFKKMFLELSVMANHQAAIWATQMAKNNLPVPAEYVPDLRTRIIAKLIKWIGPRRLKLILAATKVRGMSVYRNETIGHEFPKVFGELEHHHRRIKNSGNLRAAVFGINDGLLSNASLILGVAGATADPKFILLSGVAGLLAGACSMGSGEYVSVRSQREMLEYQLELEKHELDTYPEEEAAELALIYEARGIPKEDAIKISNVLIQDPDKALETLAREELGINPDDLGSPWGAATSSFISFVIGAFLPLIPFLISNNSHNLLISISLTGIGLFSVGAVISLFTQRSAIWSGLRMLLIGTAAGSLTYFMGSLFGT
jgi:VIT1/CCC1 family predicted Fe2+/Mn2+ transporter